jgi:four helix bundle protein
LKTHKDLDVWKNSVDLVVSIYEITKMFPKEEMYGMTNQLRRAAVSIPSNIAEGAARAGNKEFIQFLYISLGSMSELETQLVIANKISYISEGILSELLNKINLIRSQISGLIKYLKEKK